MGTKTRTAIPIAILILAVFVVGCAFSRSQMSKESGEGARQSQPSEPDDQSSDLPEPTGKVDDVTNAILDDANKEQAYDETESGAAESAASGSDDISSIANAYDQDSL